MEKRYSFEAVIKSEGGGGAFVEVPFDVEKTFGKSRVPVVADFEGVEYRGTLVRMKSECHLLLIRKEIREHLNKQAGDSIKVVLSEDSKPRVVEIPGDVRAMFARNTEAENFFHTLSFTHQREYIEWITGAKRDETRKRRVAKMLVLLTNKQKEPR